MQKAAKLNASDKIIKYIAGLLTLAEALGKVSKACQVVSCSRDTPFTDEDFVESLHERTSRKLSLANRVHEAALRPVTPVPGPDRLPTTVIFTS